MRRKLLKIKENQKSGGLGGFNMEGDPPLPYRN
jgi:hypothetical protein